MSCSLAMKLAAALAEEWRRSELGSVGQVSTCHQELRRRSGGEVGAGDDDGGAAVGGGDGVGEGDGEGVGAGGGWMRAMGLAGRRRGSRRRLGR